MNSPIFQNHGSIRRRLALGVGTWVGGWLVMLRLDGTVDLANLAMVVILTAAVAAMWLPVGLSVLCSSFSVLAFNWSFVPPRRTLAVELPQDGLLLATMLLVTWIVALLMSRQRVATQAARLHERHADQLRRFAETLLHCADPLAEAQWLQTALHQLTSDTTMLLVLKEEMPAKDERDSAVVMGSPTEDEYTGLWHCARQRVAFGPGTGRYEEQPAWYLPLRGRQASFGAAILRTPIHVASNAILRRQAQALCNQFAFALERALAARTAERAREMAQLQTVRNAMLAALSHDYRTPLATIMGAASSLTEQHDKLSPSQRRRLAETITEEALRLSRLTDNALQLGRLNTPGVELHLDWESPEELVGALMRRARRHAAGRKLCSRIEPGIPLVRCDALLLSQMLDNLVDNALKYSEADTTVEVVARPQPGHVVFAVQDRGIGVAPDWRERIFDAFQRGPLSNAMHLGQDVPARRGAGVGLAVCRAIARAHEGDLRYRNRARGGSSFEFWLPKSSPPPVIDAPASEPA